MGNPAIPRLLQYQFEKNNISDVKAYNFGVVSSVTSMELARLVFEVINYEPDLIISYSGFNDINEPFLADPRPGYPFNYFISEANPILDSNISEYPFIPLMAYSSHLLRHFASSYFLKQFSDIHKVQKETGWRSQAWMRQIADVYIQNMIKSQKIAGAFNADFVAFFQPCLYFKDHISDEEKKFVTPGMVKDSLTLREMILNRFKESRKKTKLNLIDLSDMFDHNHKTVYKDRVHVWHTYRPTIAAEIYRHINASSPLKQPPQ